MRHFKKYWEHLENHPEVEEQIRLTGRAEKSISEIEAEGIINVCPSSTWWGFRLPSFIKGWWCDWKVIDDKSIGDKLPPSLQDDRILIWTPLRPDQTLPDGLMRLYEAYRLQMRV